MFIYFHQSPCTINFHNTERVRLSTSLPSEPSCCPASRSRRRRPPRSWSAADGCRARTCRCRRSRSSRARSTTGTASSCSSGPSTHQLFSQKDRVLKKTLHLISHLSRSVLVELGQPVCEGAGSPLITAVRVTELLTQHHLHRLAGARPGRCGILHDDENSYTAALIKVEKILNVLLVTSAGSGGCRCWLAPTTRSGCAPPRTRPGPDTRPSAATCCTAPGRGTRARGRGARATWGPWCGRSARTETAASSGTRFSARTCLGMMRKPQKFNKSYKQILPWAN